MNLLVLLTLFSATNALKILGLFPYAGKSHFLVFEPLLKELAKRGHQMTIVSEFPREIPLANYKDIPLKKSLNMEIVNLQEMPLPFLRKYATVNFLLTAAQETCKKLDQKPVRDLMKTTEKFDLILIEFFNTDCFMGFVHKLQIPFIGLSSCYEMTWSLNAISNPANPSYIPNHFGNFNVKMNFWERLENTVLYLYTNAFYYWFMEGNEWGKTYFGRDLPPLHTIARNTSLFLVNTIPALNGAKPKVPLMVEVGGMNIGVPKRVAPMFQIPLIGLSSSYELNWSLNAIANPVNPSYIPNRFGNFNVKMDFWERLENTFLHLYTNAIYYWFMEGNVWAKKYFGQDLPPLHTIARNTSLFLVNTFPALNGARPKVPGMIEVGGLNLGIPKRVPKNLEKWINESTHGVIYFSMGSMIKGHTFPEDKLAMFQRAFAKLKQRVLWKWETDTMSNKPNNVMIQKWMPQFDILCHPNVKAFITHGGLLGTTEAVHCGVPAIVMPQFGDQYTNAKALEASGGGVILDFSAMLQEDVDNALRTVLDPSFNKQAKELSARFKDRPMPPLETAVYWVEYVARHKGAPHLRSAAVGMPWYQYLLLDVIAFLAAVLFTILYVVYWILTFLIRLLFGKKGKPKQKKQ